ncbi:auxin-responsive protein SAUR50-like [Cucurbita pepo subsp. pepo]|uniref:Auxin-responsive protein SAUR50-like n=1 Tax=Cucurbita moschata TaxID=3662 RepID=A0A6J1GWA8_CUCMO|nr:auxin-responsive protein SAUR50-like [Cucurbita moschata]XP_023527039.1 auxin-responsive protein SAUR50-like [Cucurbita pepo subsp. pepo]
MAKLGKLTKLKSAIKRWPSISKLSRTTTSSAVSSAALDEDHNLHPVFVGRSRRRYLLSSDVVQHPLFQEVVDKSSPNSDEEGVVVSCEVVLFEHLLWMLENADTQLGSADELVQFYT